MFGAAKRTGFEPAAIGAGQSLSILEKAIDAAGATAQVIEIAGFSVIAVPAASGVRAAAQAAAKKGAKAKKKAGEALVARQRLLEAAHAAAPVLPVAPGAHCDTKSELEAFVVANSGLLRDALDEFGEMEQYQIIVDLPFETALARMKAGDGWDALQASGAAARTPAEKAAFGAGIAAAVAQLTATLGELATDALEPITSDLVELPKSDDTTSLNAAILIRRDGGDEIEAALEEIDAAWSGALKIRMIGPSPATSFASVLIERQDLKAAADALGVAPEAAPDEVDAAYRAIMRQTHPDRAGAEGHDRSAEVSAAAALMRRSAEARASMATAGLLSAAHAAPIARLYRDGGGAR